MNGFGKICPDYIGRLIQFTDKTCKLNNDLLHGQDAYRYYENSFYDSAFYTTYNRSVDPWAFSTTDTFYIIDCRQAKLNQMMTVLCPDGILRVWICGVFSFDDLVNYGFIKDISC